jgi:hypothetical protein
MLLIRPPDYLFGRQNTTIIPERSLYQLKEEALRLSPLARHHRKFARAPGSWYGS